MLVRLSDGHDWLQNETRLLKEADMAKKKSVSTKKEIKRVVKLDRRIARVQRKIDKWSKRKVELEAERDLGSKRRKKK